ncbi:hyaluronan and proteoglycan link protein 4-like [Xyrichtys novacula]|uniref:Hyaluronan and proteoglycan link protein 4-like n=1 Tax=Xyrichtys novacula TaxID=13765 RepID=A0AAV1EN04_XYRNO|nr:hyaluronan and proteoglycan link protein 4-like [Xyrichtys novacula]
MRRSAEGRFRTAALCLGLILTHLVHHKKPEKLDQEEKEVEEEERERRLGGEERWKEGNREREKGRRRERRRREEKEREGERGGVSVQVLSQPGEPVTLPCTYGYEDHAHLSQLSVQWRSPAGALLCHFIKHKSFRKCSEGYAISYAPANITLHIHHAKDHDFGTHVCSVSKPHEFYDSRVELSRTTEAETSAPNGGQARSGPSWTLLPVLVLTLFVCMKRSN